MPTRRHVGAGRTTAPAFWLNSTYQFWNLAPAIFLDWTMMHHNGYHFVELFLCKKRSSRILSINCGTKVALGLKWFECLQVKTSSFPRATDSEPNRVTVFLACKTAPNSRRSSVFKQTMQFWIWYLLPKWILWSFWHWHSCKVCKQGDVVLGRGQACKSTCSRVHRKQFILFKEHDTWYSIVIYSEGSRTAAVPRCLRDRCGICSWASFCGHHVSTGLSQRW